MGKQYNAEAVEQCLRLYLKYNGQQHARIEQDMRRLGYAGWRRNNLYDRGKGKNVREGWINKYQWEKTRLERLAQAPMTTLSNAEKLVREIEEVRRYLYVEIAAVGGRVDKDRLQLHRDYCNLSIGALTKVEAARDTLSAWVSFWERLIDWSVDIDARLAKTLVKHAEALIGRAEKEFGETREMIDVADSAAPETEPGAETTTS